MPTNPSGRSFNRSRTAFQHFQEQLKYVDLVIEICDGRVPFSSRHPRSEEIFGSKARILLLTKEDLADPLLIKEWLTIFASEEGQRQAKTLSLSLKEQKHKSRIFELVLELTKEKRAQLAAKGILPRPSRICVVGMPNVGKSSLINWLIGQKKAKVGNKPGVTKGAQWVRVHPDIELLDTPGILPAFSFSPSVALKLALFNLMPENTYDVVEIATNGIALMKSRYPKRLETYISQDSDSLNLEGIARKRNLLITGGRLDTVRAANIFVRDLRDAKLGRVTLDQPQSAL